MTDAILPRELLGVVCDAVLALDDHPPLVLALDGVLDADGCALGGLAQLDPDFADREADRAYGIGGGLGFSLVMVLFSGVRERLDFADVPTPFRGTAIALVTAGMMALGFIGFTGLVQE